MIGERWGVSAAETTRTFPCDRLVPRPVVQLWRGVTIDAPPERVWPWVAQIRLAPYSYDWIDNCGRRSPQELRELPDPVPGEPFTTAAGRRIGRVVDVEPGRSLTGSIAGEFMSYVLEPHGRGTRLLLKVAGGGGRITPPLLSLGDLVMARRQLLNFKRLAERAATPANVQDA